MRVCSLLLCVFSAHSVCVRAARKSLCVCVFRFKKRKTTVVTQKYEDYPDQARSGTLEPTLAAEAAGNKPGTNTVLKHTIPVSNTIPSKLPPLNIELYVKNKTTTTTTQVPRDPDRANRQGRTARQGSLP